MTRLLCTRHWLGRVCPPRNNAYTGKTFPQYLQLPSFLPRLDQVLVDDFERLKPVVLPVLQKMLASFRQLRHDETHPPCLLPRALDPQLLLDSCLSRWAPSSGGNRGMWVGLCRLAKGKPQVFQLFPPYTTTTHFAYYYSLRFSSVNYTIVQTTLSQCSFTCLLGYTFTSL